MKRHTLGLFLFLCIFFAQNSLVRINLAGAASYFRLVSTVSDNVNPALPSYLDIVSSTIETDDVYFLRFNMTLRGAIPDSHLFTNKTLDDHLSYAWWIDVDRNLSTGQNHQYVGSEYNVLLQASGGSPAGEWGARVDVPASDFQGGGDVQFSIQGNNISLLVELSRIGNHLVFDWSATAWGSLNGSSLGSNLDTMKQTVDLDESLKDEIHQVVIIPSQLTLRDGATTGHVKALALDEDGLVVSGDNSAITYISDNSFVKVDQQGNVEASGFGTAHIGARINGSLSANNATVDFGRLEIRPPILLLSVQDNPSGTLSVVVRNSDGTAPLYTQLEIEFYVSSGSTEVATVSSDGTVTAHRPPEDFGETPYVSATVNGTYTHNSAVIRVTNTSLGLVETEYSGTYVSFYSPPTNGAMNYNKTIHDYEMISVTDIVYSLMKEATGIVPFSSDTQFLVADPGHADKTVPYGYGGNPIRLGVDVDTGNSGFIINEQDPIPVWWVYFHEMGHGFLDEGVRISQFLKAPTGRDSPYSEAFASVLGMYAAAMMQQREDQYQIPSSILQTQTLLPTYHLDSTPDLDRYRLTNNYSQLNVSVVYDIMLTMARNYGFSKLIRFFAIFLPRDVPFPLQILSDEDQATFFVAALGSAVNDDLRPFFLNLNFPINETFYATAKGITDIAAKYRDPNAQPGPSRIVKAGTSVQLDGSSSFDILQDPITFNWTLTSKPLNSNATLIAPDTSRSYFTTDIAGQYVISLTVSNDLLVGSPRQVVILAKDDVEPPSISDPYRIPQGDALPDQQMNVFVNVTDAQSGVKNVTLSYTTDNGTSWTGVSMNYNLTIGLWNGTIPSQPYGILVTFKIVAYDNAENKAVNEGESVLYAYHVIMEFPPSLVSLLLILFTIAAFALTRRKASRRKSGLGTEKDRCFGFGW